MYDTICSSNSATLKGIKMRCIRTPVGIYDKYNCGKVVYIDFTYQDHIVVWVQYKTVCKAYLWSG